MGVVTCLGARGACRAVLYNSSSEDDGDDNGESDGESNGFALRPSEKSALGEKTPPGCPAKN